MVVGSAQLMIARRRAADKGTSPVSVSQRFLGAGWSAVNRLLWRIPNAALFLNQQAFHEAKLRYCKNGVKRRKIGGTWGVRSTSFDWTRW